MKYSRILLLLEVMMWLVVLRIALFIFSFQSLCQYLRHPMREASHCPINNVEKLHDISCTIELASRLVPFECKCLLKAMTAMIMLKKRLIKSTLYLGVAKDHHANLYAHAWLYSGHYCLTGNHHLDSYSIIYRLTQVTLDK